MAAGNLFLGILMYQLIQQGSAAGARETDSPAFAQAKGRLSQPELSDAAQLDGGFVGLIGESPV